MTSVASSQGSGMVTAVGTTSKGVRNLRKQLASGRCPAPGRVVAQAPGNETGRESLAQRWLPMLLMLMGVYERRVRAGYKALQRDRDPPSACASVRLVTGSMGG